MKTGLKSSTAIIIVLAFAVLVGGGALAYFYYNQPTGFDYEIQGFSIHKKTKASPTAPVGSLYVNSKYKFTMFFGDALWKNYKATEVAATDGLATAKIYFSVPTTDSTYTDASGVAGYASPLAVTVYTLDGYSKYLASSQLKYGLIKKSDKYAFTWMPWQTMPTDLKGKDYKILNATATLAITP